MSSIRGRLEKLESANGRGLTMVWMNAGESEDAAIARWMAANAGKPDPRDSTMTIYLVSWTCAADSKTAGAMA